MHGAVAGAAGAGRGGHCLATGRVLEEVRLVPRPAQGEEALGLGQSPGGSITGGGQSPEGQSLTRGSIIDAWVNH